MKQLSHKPMCGNIKYLILIGSNPYSDHQLSAWSRHTSNSCYLTFVILEKLSLICSGNMGTWLVLHGWPLSSREQRTREEGKTQEEQMERDVDQTEENRRNKSQNHKSSWQVTGLVEWEENDRKEKKQKDEHRLQGLLSTCQDSPSQKVYFVLAFFLNWTKDLKKYTWSKNTQRPQWLSKHLEFQYLITSISSILTLLQPELKADV